MTAKSKKTLTENSHRIKTTKTQNVININTSLDVIPYDYIKYIDMILCMLHLISGCVIVSEIGKYSRDIRVNICSESHQYSIVVASFDIMLSIAVYFWITSQL